MFVSDVHVAVEDEREVCFRVRSDSARRRKEGRVGTGVHSSSRLMTKKLGVVACSAR